MAKRIKPEDLFDFDGYEQRIKEMSKLNEKFGKDNIDMLNHIKDAQKPFLDNLQKFIDLAEKTNVAQKGATDALRTYEKETEETTAALLRQKKLQDLLNDSYNSSEKSIKVLKDGVNILRNEYEKLDPTQKDFAEQQAKIAQKSKELKVAIDAQTVVMKAANSTVKAAAGSYAELNKETNELRNRLKNLPDAFDKVTGAINKTNKEATELQRQIQQNDKVLKNFDASIGNHQRNVGNYSSALGGVTRSVGALGLAFVGLDSAYTVIDKLFTTIVEFDRLDSALKNVTNSTQEFNQSQAFIERLANRNGQNIQVLTKSYMSLLAASRGTNLEGLQTQRIFTALTNAGVALKLSNDDLEGALRAVQQMMSKGNVSAEELRGQLGERLYGAFNLAAKAIGVTTAQLNDMLKKGEVLASDLLPRFATELNKLYGDKAAQNLQTISGSWENLTNQVSLLIKDLSNSSGIQNFFTIFNNGISDTLKSVRILVQSQEWSQLMAYTGSKVLGLNLGVEKDVKQKLEDEKRAESELLRFQQMSFNERKKFIDGYRKSLSDAQKDYNQSLTDANSRSLLGRTFFGSSDQKERKEFIREIGIYENILKKAQDEASLKGTSLIPPISTGGGGDKDQLTQIQILEKAIADLNDVLENQVLLTIRANKEAADDVKVQATLKELEAKKLLLAQVKEEIALMQLRKKLTIDLQQIDPRMGKVTGMKLEKQFTGKVDSFVNVNPKSIGDRSQDIGFTGEQSGIVGRALTQLAGANTYKEILRIEKVAFLELDALKLKAETKGQKDRIDLAKKELDQKIEYRKNDLKDDEENEEKKKIKRQQALSLSIDIANQSFEFLTSLRNRELEAIQAQKDHELSIVGDNTEAKANVERKFAGELLEIKRKQARADKAQAAFNIGINTAAGIMQTIKQLGMPAAIPFVIATGILGALQLATVLAKPLPQFFKGTDNAPEGFAWVAEKGPELRESKGKTIYYDKPQIAYLNQGDKIHTAEQTQKILAQNTVNQELGNRAAQVRMMEVKFQNNSTTFDENKLGSVLEKALDRRPIYTTYLEQGELKQYAETVNSRTTYNDNRYSLPR